MLGFEEEDEGLWEKDETVKLKKTGKQRKKAFGEGRGREVTGGGEAREEGRLGRAWEAGRGGEEEEGRSWKT